MKSAKIHLEQNIIRVKNLGAIYKNINSQTTQILDLSDILRAQYVMLVSALDHFIHEIVRFGMIEIYKDKRKETKKFKEFIFGLDAKIINKDNIEPYKDTVWLDYQIRYKNGFKSFQQADKIREAMLLITDKDIWEELSSLMNQDSKMLKNKLNLIVDRRNQIAHEADIKFEDKELRDIRSDDIDNSIIFIESLVISIFKISELDS